MPLPDVLGMNRTTPSYIHPLFDVQVLQEETAIPGSDLNLMYLSSRAAGYRPVLKVTMTQATIPFNLMKVHLMVAVVGRLFQKWFPAEPNLSYTFIWDKTDAYNQRVYGLSEAVGMYTFSTFIVSFLTPFGKNKHLCTNDVVFVVNASHV